MTDYDKLEEQRQMARSNYYAQLAMMGYDSGGNPLDMVHVVRCRDCKWFDCKNYVCNSDIMTGRIADCGCYPNFNVDPDWYCADGERRG